MGLFQGPGGEFSSLRLCVVVSTMTGCACVIAGIVALFMSLHDAGTALAIGGGMAGVGELAKAIQAKAGR